MENFVVSARKYRPDTFDTVVGQSHITTTLKNALQSGQLAQSFLFCGPRGVGKTTCARIFAKTINCMQVSSTMEACGECESCRSFKDSVSFNIYELDAASNTGVDDIRALIEQVRIPPQVGKFKVYIIDEVHMLSTAAFNAFLKTLEEPPAYAKFILATTEKHKILPTILSRCQIFDFKRIKIANMVEHLHSIALKEGVEVEDDALHVIAQKADGGLRDALSMFDQLVSFAGGCLSYSRVVEMLNILDYEQYFRMTNAFLSADIPLSLKMFNAIIDSGFEGQHFLNGLGEYFRNLLVMKDPSTHALLEVGEAAKQKYIEQTKLVSLPFLIKALDMLNQCDLQYRNSNNKRLSVEILLMQLCTLSSPIESLDGATSPVAPPPVATPPVATPPVAPPPAVAPISTDTPSFKDASAAMYAPKSKISSIPSFSLKNMKEEISRGAEESKNKELTRAYTEQEFLFIWREYVKSIAHQTPSLYAILSEHTPECRDNNWYLLVNTPFHADEVNDAKFTILSYIREKLQNTTLNFTVEIQEEEREKLAYAPQEKYQKMLGTNPHLKDFKESLDLELEL